MVNPIFILLQFGYQSPFLLPAGVGRHRRSPPPPLPSPPLLSSDCGAAPRRRHGARDEPGGTAAWRAPSSPAPPPLSLARSGGHGIAAGAGRRAAGRVSFTDRTGQTAGVRYRYTGLVWPETGRYRSNSNLNSKNSVQPVRTGIPAG